MTTKGKPPAAALARLIEREGTSISWADLTFNPWIGCTKVSPACDNCYAETLATNRLGIAWGPHADRRRTAASTWAKPRRWNRIAAAAGVQLRVFCASLADIFDNQVPPEWRADLWQLIEATPNLTWMLLTKRPQNVARMLPRSVFPDRERIPANIAIGTTVEDQEHADQRLWPLACIAEVTGWPHFISGEPLLGSLDLARVKIPGTQAGQFNALTGHVAAAAIHARGGSAMLGRTDPVPPLKLVITGGESGTSARPSHPDWFRELRDQCATTGIPFHFKQWGEWEPSLDRDRDDPDWRADYTNDYVDQGKSKWLNLAGGCGFHGERFHVMRRVGKKAAGRHLDGVIHDAQLGEERP
ncbi:phage Gp37/Gp68 family protein [Sphingomonas sp.]|uniref:phage Gp37/Gp68 family protein n=1 Tax=Sphingomonas sp. TaxID=28214 RepID=UPI00307ECAFF